MALAVFTGVTRDGLFDAVRREARDPALNRSGLTIAAAQLKYADDEVLTAITDALLHLGTEMAGYNPAESLDYVDSSYGADLISLALPAGVPSGAPVLKVEDITDPSRPQRIAYVSARDIEDYSASTTTAYIPIPNFRYSLSASGATKALLIRPRPRGALAIRIWYIAPPTVVGAAADIHPLTLFWGELIKLLAATKLMRRTGGAEEQQLAQLADLMVQFRSFSNRQRGTQRVRRVRRGVS